ncbi:hypothetical protein BLNAU_24929 [Blattamonas nauphoetae]|uniref:Uncharacterized protein n=1 Tax=Blattamonas nauphoetae TaxID=2049346 RepID=A0ABQ9WL28_9EUKA|nr:hypothetical protein BLNAU_24929 [Blattamonas nauphoetae]
MESSVLIESDGVVEIESCTFSDITRSILNATVVHTTSEKGSVSVTQEKFLSCFGGSEERWVELTDGNQTALAQTSWRQFVLASDSERMDEIDNTAREDDPEQSCVHASLCQLVSPFAVFKLGRNNKNEGTTRRKEQQERRNNGMEGTTRRKEQQERRNNKKEGATGWKEQQE